MKEWEQNLKALKSEAESPLRMKKPHRSSRDEIFKALMDPGVAAAQMQKRGKSQESFRRAFATRGAAAKPAAPLRSWRDAAGRGAAQGAWKSKRRSSDVKFLED